MSKNVRPFLNSFIPTGQPRAAPDPSLLSARVALFAWNEGRAIRFVLAGNPLLLTTTQLLRQVGERRGAAGTPVLPQRRHAQLLACC